MSDNEAGDQRESSSNAEAITSAVFEQFKTYLDSKIESISSGFDAATTSHPHKLQRQAEAQSLKFSGN